MTEDRPLDILLIEDNPGDVRLFQEAFKEFRKPNSLHLSPDGEDAMSFLLRQGRHAAAPRPDLILLDLNLPKKDGREVLAEIKRDEWLKTIPLVVFTTSQMEQDIADCYGLHANCYIKKPIGIKDYMDAVRSIESFWLNLVKLPPKAG